MLDMSDSVKIEQALRDRNDALSEADAIKGRFLANMSYEFRTPLTSISGFADLLRTGIAGELNDQAREYVEAIATSAERLSQQINTVLDYSQGEAGALPIARSPIDVGIMLAEILDEYEEAAVSRGVSLQTEIPDGLGEILGDEKRLKQAIGHLLDNAIRYGKEDGRVILAAARGRKNVEIGISDNGPGMSNKEQASAFDGFGRSQNENHGGQQGLGLPLARQLVEAHGGNLLLESEQGRGTTIILKLPRQ